MYPTQDPTTPGISEYLRCGSQNHPIANTATSRPSSSVAHRRSEAAAAVARRVEIAGDVSSPAAATQLVSIALHSRQWRERRSVGMSFAGIWTSHASTEEGELRMPLG